MINDVKELNFPTREKILRYLLFQGSTSDEKTVCTAKNIAKVLGLSSNVVWNYLVTLEQEGFVHRKEKKGRTGRPANVYFLSEKGLEFFPKAYMEFCITVLDEIKSMFGDNVIETLFSNIGKRIANDIKRQTLDHPQNNVSYNSLDKKLEKIINVFEGYGTFPELIENETSFALKNYNCIMHGVAKVNPLVCRIDETLLYELLGQKAIKENCIREGDRYCLFRMKKEKKIVETV